MRCIDTVIGDTFQYCPPFTKNFLLGLSIVSLHLLADLGQFVGCHRLQNTNKVFGGFVEGDVGQVVKVTFTKPVLNGRAVVFIVRMRKMSLRRKS